MISDSVASFLEVAKASRLLPLDLLEEVARHAEQQRSRLHELCDNLEKRGQLTTYQAQLLRAGQVTNLVVGGYPITGVIGPCPGGEAFQALHPSLRTPLILRRLRADWLAPADHSGTFVQRAQLAAPIVHPHLAHLLDASLVNHEPLITQDPVEGDNLFMLVQDIGAMPTALAKLAIAQTAEALWAIHQRGFTHGMVGPGVMVIGPLVPMSRRRDDGTPKMRPGPNARVILTEFGLVPKRPPLLSWLEDPRSVPLEFAFAAPERLRSEETTPEGDVFSLGASFYYLLTSVAPRPFRTGLELRKALESGSPPPLGQIRPDLPADVVALIEAMMASDPSLRPSIPRLIQELGQPDSPAAQQPPSGTPVVLTTIEPVTGAESVPLLAASASDPDLEPIPLEANAPDVEDVPTLQSATEQQPGSAMESEEVLQWTGTQKLTEPVSGIGSLTASNFDSNSASSTDLATLAPVKPDASWPGFPTETASRLPQTGWPGFSGPEAVPMAEPVPWEAQPVPIAQPVDEHPEPLDHSPVASGPSASTRPAAKPVSKGNVWLWVGIGAGLQVLAILGWVYLLMSPGCSSTPAPNPPKKRG